MKLSNSIVPFGLAIALIALGSAFWKVSTAEHERAEAQGLLANINAQPAIEADSVKTDKDGQTLHTLCIDNWCVTDRVPPESFVKNDGHQTPARNRGFPTIDVAAVEAAIRRAQDDSRDGAK